MYVKRHMGRNPLLSAVGVGNMENITCRSWSGHLGPKESNQDSGKSTCCAGPHPCVWSPRYLLPWQDLVLRLSTISGFRRTLEPGAYRLLVSFRSGRSPMYPSSAPRRCAQRIILPPALALCVLSQSAHVLCRCILMAGNHLCSLSPRPQSIATSPSISPCLLLSCRLGASTCLASACSFVFAGMFDACRTHTYHLVVC